MFDLLLWLGATINGPVGDEGGVIHYAIMSEDESMVQHALNRGATLVDSPGHYSSIQTAISWRRGIWFRSCSTMELISAPAALRKRWAVGGGTR